MSIANYCQCRIQFQPNDRRRKEIQYSARSLIELRQHELAEYSIRGVDLDNNRAEIFNIPLNNTNEYKRSRSSNEPDTIESNNGVYCIWLNETSRNSFYETLAESIAEIELIRGVDTKPPSPRTNTAQQLNPTTESQASSHDQNWILTDAYELGQCIQQGNIEKAVALSRKLAQIRVALEATQIEQFKGESKIRIRIKIDSNDEQLSKQYPLRSLDVYPSTTIRELRTALQYDYNRLPPNQYFFVNGHLAHDTSTMEDLRVKENSLFVLFAIQP